KSFDLQQEVESPILNMSFDFADAPPAANTSEAAVTSILPPPSLSLPSPSLPSQPPTTQLQPPYFTSEGVRLSIDHNLFVSTGSYYL
ncbi:12670_t:CDS:2, partial [Funneliformis mosseae]